MPVEEQLLYDAYQFLRAGQNIRHGQHLTIPNRKVSKLVFVIARYGNPPGDVTFTIRKVSDDSIIASKVWGAASTLSTDPEWKEVTFDTPVIVNEEVRILVEYNAGDPSNMLKHYFWNADVKAGEYVEVYYNTTWVDYPARDTAYQYTYTTPPPPPPATIASPNLIAIIRRGV